MFAASSEDVLMDLAMILRRQNTQRKWHKIIKKMTVPCINTYWKAWKEMEDKNMAHLLQAVMVDGEVVG
jgi:hypothetical protein